MKTLRLGMACVLAACVLGLGACEQSQRADPGDVRIRRPLPITYDELASRYNRDIEQLGVLWGRATTQVRYRDDDGQQRLEQGEGHLQIVRPDRVALSIGKVGQMLLWLGCDDTRYWWFDMTGKQHVAFVGRHDGAARRAAAHGHGPGGLTGNVSPRLVTRLLGVVPLPTGFAAGGSVEWSRDGKQLVVASNLPAENPANTESPARARASARQRLWFVPETLALRRVELIDPQGRVEVSAELDDDRFVEIRDGSGLLPGVPGKAFITHEGSGTEIRLFLDGLEGWTSLDGRPKGQPADGQSETPAVVPRVKAAAFSFEALVKVLRADKVIDLDQVQEARDRRAAGSSTPAPAGEAPKVPDSSTERRARPASGE